MVIYFTRPYSVLALTTNDILLIKQMIKKVFGIFHCSSILFKPVQPSRLPAVAAIWTAPHQAIFWIYFIE